MRVVPVDSMGRCQYKHLFSCEEAFAGSLHFYLYARRDNLEQRDLDVQSTVHERHRGVAVRHE